MIVHALHILRQELNMYLDSFGTDLNNEVVLGNIAQLETVEQSQGLRNKVVMTLVGIKEEKTLKNEPFSRRNEVTMKTEYFNPPVFLNLYLLVTASHNNYTNALIFLSRTAAFFQGKAVFTHFDTAALSAGANVPDTERMSEFKLIVDLYSPGFEEQNHIWGMLGGRQLPSLLYFVRLLEVKRAVEHPAGDLIEQIDINAKPIDKPIVP